MNAFAEQTYWDSLNDEAARINTAGVPPYDAEAVADRIVALNPSARRVLDLGCGDGRLTHEVARLLNGTAHVYGCDISIRMLHRAALTARANESFSRCDGRRLPALVTQWQFDLAYSVAMFQHIPHGAMWSYLHQIERALAPGASFTFTVAVGDTDEFLNHQLPGIVDFGEGLMMVFDSAAIAYLPDVNGWTWVTVTKAPS